MTPCCSEEQLIYRSVQIVMNYITLTPNIALYNNRLSDERKKSYQISKMCVLQSVYTARLLRDACWDSFIELLAVYYLAKIVAGVNVFSCSSKYPWKGWLQCRSRFIDVFSQAIIHSSAIDRKRRLVKITRSSLWNSWYQISLFVGELTHWGRDKMAGFISRRHFQKHFISMKIYKL